MPHYLIGYGSLINSKSRARTGKSGAAVAVRVKGYARGWISPVYEDRTTYLGVERNDQASVNGVLFPIDERELPRFDARETGYDRVVVVASTVAAIRSAELPTGTIWIYMAVNPRPPTPQCPIVQSYVDVVLDGCLSYGEEFAAEFMRSTSHWEGPWLDDREQPKYPRGIADRAALERIDRLLAEHQVLGQRLK